jgi:hypothetical protein
MWAELPEIKAKRYQKLRQQSNYKLNEYYLMKSFFALQNNYEITKEFKESKKLQKLFDIFRALRKNSAVEVIKKYKISIIQDQINDGVKKKIFDNLRVYYYKYGLLR